MLQLRPSCECCNRDLPAESADAVICSFECTFCRDCAEGALGGRCPNCGGELVARPRRPAEKLGKFPASTERVFKPQGCGRRVGRVVATLLVAGLAGIGTTASAQTAQPATSVGRTPVASRELPGDPARSLTAIVVELPPGIKVGSHQHAGTVFAYVVEGSVRSQLNDGEVVEYKTGQSWMEPPGTTHSLTENPSPSAPARLLAVFVAPTGAQLTTPGR
jgi:quercetin dioxygenase-like cupin family protein